MLSLMNACQDSERVRGEAGLALEALGRDFNRDFSPHDHPHRRPARSLIIKASNIVSRLQATNKSLEFAASQCVHQVHFSTRERDATILSLQAEVRRLDEDLQDQFRMMRDEMDEHRSYVLSEAAVNRSVTLNALRDAEGELDAARAELRHEKEARKQEQAIAKEEMDKLKAQNLKLNNIADKLRAAVEEKAADARLTSAAAEAWAGQVV